MFEFEYINVKYKEPKYLKNYFASKSNWHGNKEKKWKLTVLLIISLLLSRSVVSDSLRPHGLQHARPPCPSLTPGAYSNLCPSSRWCHSTISSSVLPFSSCLQSLPASGSFPVSQFFTPGGQSWSFSFRISPSNEYSALISFRIDWLDLLAVQGTLTRLLQHHSSKASILQCSASLLSNFHICTWPLEKP